MRFRAVSRHATGLKSGTATKVLLESLVCAAVHGAERLIPALDAYLLATREAYSDPDGLARLVELAGAALRAQHRVWYVASHGGLGAVAVIDASECPPTFGALPEDVQARVEGGWEAMGLALARGERPPQLFDP